MENEHELFALNIRNKRHKEEFNELRTSELGGLKRYDDQSGPYSFAHCGICGSPAALCWPAAVGSGADTIFTPNHSRPHVEDPPCCSLANKLTPDKGATRWTRKDKTATSIDCPHRDKGAAVCL